MAKVVLSNGVKIHYQQVGEGPDVVMVHGITGNLAIWHLNILPALVDRYRVLTYDLRGHGLSSTPPTNYSLDDMADDLYRLLDALGIEKPVVVGHSYGADVALYLAANHPHRLSEVIAIEAALPAMEEVRKHSEWVGWEYWVRALEEAGLPIPPEHRNDLRYLIRATIDMPKKWGPLAGLPRNPKPMLKLLEQTSLPEDYRKIGSLTLDRLPTISTPVTLLYADRSAFVDTFEYLREHLPNVHPVLLPQTEWGHFGPLEQPEMVAAQIAARLDGAQAAGVTD
jgi:pimeloyl-ACP methyl ester carboxylesterase